MLRMETHLDPRFNWNHISQFYPKDLMDPIIISNEQSIQEEIWGDSSKELKLLELPITFYRRGKDI